MPKKRLGSQTLYEDELHAARELDDGRQEFLRWTAAWRELGLDDELVEPTAPCVFSKRAFEDMWRVPQGRRLTFAQGLAEALDDPNAEGLEALRYAEASLFRWRRSKRQRVLLHAFGGRWCLLTVYVQGVRSYIRAVDERVPWRFHVYGSDGAELGIFEATLEPHEARKFAQAQLGRLHQGHLIESIRVRPKLGAHFFSDRLL